MEDARTENAYAEKARNEKLRELIEGIRELQTAHADYQQATRGIEAHSQKHARYELAINALLKMSLEIVSDLTGEPVQIPRN